MAKAYYPQAKPIKKSAYQLLKILKDEIVHTTDIGVQLRIPLGELKKLKAETMKNKRPLKECFTEMLDTWMKGASDRTWGQVFEALEDKNNKLKEDMQKIHKENEKVCSKLDELVNALDEMTAEWYMFGLALGVDPKDLDIIKCSDGMDRYMLAMLQLWLNKGSATWKELIDAVTFVGNNSLAEKIQLNYAI